LKGRDEIETYHAAVWAGVYKDSRAAFTSLTVETSGDLNEAMQMAASGPEKPRQS
jgi:hypothetical protein